MTATTPDQALFKRAEQALSRARIAMMGRSGTAFITTVCFSLNQKLTRDIPRAGTDGQTIYYNPDYVLKLPHDQLLGLVVHETWHVALKHCLNQKHTRATDKDSKLWNIAADVVINNYIIHDTDIPLPKDDGGYIYMPEYEGKSTEYVYTQLEAKKQNSEPVPCLIDGHDDVMPLPADVDPDDYNQEMNNIIVRGSIAAQMAGEDIGNLPGNIQVTIEKLVKPRLPWDRLVERYFKASAKTAYNFTRPNRRYMPRMYLPTRHTKTLQHVLMAIDMSGSVSDKEVSQFIHEIAQLFRRAKPKKLDLLQFDTRIRDVTTINSTTQLLRHEFAGRGGTAISPVIDYANQHPSDLLVIFTDGYFRQPELTCNTPVLWVIYNNRGFTAPFGHVIHVELE